MYLTAVHAGQRGSDDEYNCDNHSKAGETGCLIALTKESNDGKAAGAYYQPCKRCKETRNRGNLVTLLRVICQSRNHRPVRDILDRVGQTPKDVQNRNPSGVALAGKTDIQIQQNQNNRVQYGTDHNPRAEPSEFRTSIINDNTHKRVINSIKNTSNKK